MPSVLLDNTAAQEDLLALAAIGSRIVEVVELASKLGPAGSIFALARAVASGVGLPESQVQDALDGIWNIKTLQRNLQLDSAAAVRFLGDRLDEEWLRAHGDDWSAAKESLCKVLDSIDEDHSILVSAKAHQLAYSHERSLVRSRLITDVRPVFDKSGDNILESVVTHTLAIQYTDGLGQQSMITFILDTDDIEGLRIACERAVRKAQAVAKQLPTLKATVLPEPSVRGI